MTKGFLLRLIPMQNVAELFLLRINFHSQVSFPHSKEVLQEKVNVTSLL